MAGVLLHEGIIKGPPPVVEVLSIGATVAVRQSNDLLPYGPKFRKLFIGLPKSAPEMSLKALKIPLVDIESIIKTVVKVSGPLWYLKIKKGINNHLDKYWRGTEA